jgi:hypothetical protein
VTVLVEISDVVGGLRARIEALAQELLPGGHREGDEWVDARRAHGGLGDSMKVKIRGPGAGTWGHFGAAKGGDALDLVAYINFGGDKKAAWRWSLNWLGLDTSKPAPQATRPAPPPKPTQDIDDGRRDAGFRLWLEAREAIAGTPVERYLAGRGIALAALARPPSALRFHHRMPYWDPPARDGERPILRGHYPAMVALVAGEPSARAGHFVALHKTYLAVHSDGRVTKADVPKPKMVYGRMKGGSIRLTRGTSNKGFNAAPPGDVVAITEGIEDALTVAIAAPELRVVAAVSLANMRNVWLPDNVAEVILVADNDGANEIAAKALDIAARTHFAAGRRVRIARPPAGVKDVNELLTRGNVA